MKEALAEKKPAWSLYYSLTDDNDSGGEDGGADIMSQQYWLRKIEA